MQVAKVILANTHSHTQIGADTQQKNELLLCCYYKALPERRVASVCVWHCGLAHSQGVVLGCRPASGGVPDVDKACYRLLSAHSVCTQRKESIRVTSQQNTVIFDF